MFGKINAEEAHADLGMPRITQGEIRAVLDLEAALAAARDLLKAKALEGATVEPGDFFCRVETGTEQKNITKKLLESALGPEKAKEIWTAREMAEFKRVKYGKGQPSTAS